MDVALCLAVQHIWSAPEQAGELVLPSSPNSGTSQLLPLGLLEAGDQMPVSGGPLKDAHGTLQRHKLC